MILTILVYLMLVSVIVSSIYSIYVDYRGNKLNSEIKAVNKELEKYINTMPCKVDINSEEFSEAVIKAISNKQKQAGRTLLNV